MSIKNNSKTLIGIARNYCRIKAKQLPTSAISTMYVNQKAPI
jgi:hypothetical protein